jgi:tetratricopeptide (TPR) repeat protein
VDGVRTSPEALRQEIRSAELALAALHPGAERRDVLGLLQCLDRIDDVAERLGHRGVDLRAERARIETIHNTTLRKSPIFTRALAGEWDTLRAKVEATRPRWWWRLDQHVATARTRRRRRAGWALVGAALALGSVAAIYVLFLRPEGTVRRRVALVVQAESLAEEGAYAEALALYRRASATAPKDPDLQVAIGVLNEALGEPQASEEAYGRAEALYGDRALYWASRSGCYLSLGWWAQGAATAQAAIELDPDLALAYCHLGSASEAQGQIREATAAVRSCGDLAREQDQDELYVLAASRLALLLRALPGE